MTKATSERLAVIETEMTGIKESLNTHITEQRDDFNRVFRKLESLEKRYAGKWVEKISIGVLIMVSSSIILFLLQNI